MRRRARRSSPTSPIQAAAKAHELGLVPRVALLSYSNFGNPMGKDGQRVRDAVALLDQRGAGFEYDGEMSADVALDQRLMRQLYPFCRLGGPANILVMPELHSANIAAKLLPQLGGGTVVGPLLLGLVAPGPDRQYGGDGLGPRQSRRPLGARRDPLIARRRRARPPR